MLNTPLPSSAADEPPHEQVDAIVSKGPSGAVALASVTTAIVIAIWFAFYLFVFIPRAMPQ